MIPIAPANMSIAELEELFASTPIHDCADLVEGDYFACAYPERPGDSECVWDWSCWGCYLHGIATYMSEGNIVLEDTDGVTADVCIFEMLQSATQWFQHIGRIPT